MEEYRMLCKGIKTPDKLKEELLETIQYQNNEKTTVGFHRNILRVAAVLLISLFGIGILGLGVYAGSRFVSHLLDDRFHINSDSDAEESEYIGTLSYPEDINTTDQGIRLSLVETASDLFGFFLALRVDGVLYDGNKAVKVEKGAVFLDGIEIPAVFGEMKWIEDGEYYELSVEYYQDIYTYDETALGKEVKVIIYSFSAEDPVEGDSKVMAEGEWAVNWTVEGNGDVRVTSAWRLDDGDNHAYFDNGILLHSIRVSSLRIDVDYIYPKEGLKEDRKFGFGMAYALDDDAFPPVPVGFLMGDGSIKRFDISAPGWSGYCDNPDCLGGLSTDDVYIYSHLTGTIVDPHSIVGVLFLDSDSEYFGTDEEYGVPELPLDEYQIFALRHIEIEEYERLRDKNYDSKNKDAVQPEEE